MVMKVWRVVFPLVLIGMIFGAQLPGASAATKLDRVTKEKDRPAQQESSGVVYLPLLSKHDPPVDNTVFGVELEYSSRTQYFQSISSNIPSWSRLFKAGVLWSEVEASPGQRDWEKLKLLDRMLIDARARRLKVIVGISSTPEWAQKEPGNTCGPIHPDHLATFGSFIHDIVARYSVSPYFVKDWEIWNEPDVDLEHALPNAGWGCWGDPSQPFFGGGYYAEVLKVVYPQVKAADPESNVIIGGLLMDCDPVNPPEGDDCSPSTYLEGILVAGGGPYFDGVAYHAYDYYLGSLGKYYNPGWNSSWDTTGPVLRVKGQYLKGLLEKYEVSEKFMMVTETAILCARCESEVVPDFEATKASYVAQSYAAAMELDLRANIWYALYGWRGSGLIWCDNTPLPALKAFNVARSIYGAAEAVTPLVGLPGVQGYSFEMNENRTWLLWSENTETTTLDVRAVPTAVYDLMGKPLEPKQLLQVGILPVYVLWENP